MKKLFLGLIFFIINSLVFADVTSSSASLPVYININNGIATQQFLPTGSWVGTLNAGYNFNSALAIEGGYALLAGSQFGSTASNNIFDVAVKGTLSLSSLFSLYGRLGAGLDYFGWSGTANAGTPSWYCTQNNSANFVGLASLGGSFKLSEHFDLRLEDTMYVPIGGGNATAGQANLVLGGVQFNF